MPFIPTPNCAQVELVYNWAGQICQTVLHYTKSAPWTFEHLTELADVARANWITEMISRQPETLALIGVRAVDLSSETGPSVEISTDLPAPGTAPNPSLPNNCAIVVTKRTALRGRSYRGRIYHPGLMENQVAGNTVDPSSLVGIVQAWETFLALSLPEIPDEALMVVLSLRNEGNPRTQGVATLVTGLTSDGTVDSQRRRLPGRGA